jgi:hypothetical protein
MRDLFIKHKNLESERTHKMVEYITLIINTFKPMTKQLLSYKSNQLF